MRESLFLSVPWKMLLQMLIGVFTPRLIARYTKLPIKQIEAIRCA